VNTTTTRVLPSGDSYLYVSTFSGELRESMIMAFSGGISVAPSGISKIVAYFLVRSSSFLSLLSSENVRICGVSSSSPVTSISTICSSLESGDTSYTTGEFGLGFSAVTGVTSTCSIVS